MNAPFHQPTKQHQLDRALLWRGHFVQHFAQAEMLAGDCLQLFESQPDSSGQVKRRLQIKAAVEELRRLIDPEGPCTSIGRSLLPSVKMLASFLDWRAPLTHGFIEVWRDRADWYVGLRFREGDSSGEMQWHGLPLNEAEDMLRTFKTQVGIFEQRCDALQRRLSSGGAEA